MALLFFSDVSSEMEELRKQTASRLFAIGYYYLNDFEKEEVLDSIPFEKKIATLDTVMKHIIYSKDGKFDYLFDDEFVGDDKLNEYLIQKMIESGKPKHEKLF